VNFPLYARIARAEANIRREAGFVEAARLSGNADWRILVFQILPNVFPILVVQMSLTMGYAILQWARGPVVHRARRAAADAGVGHHGGGGRHLHGVGRMVERILSRRRADGRGVLLQSSRRRAARHGRSAEAHVTAAPALSVEG